MQNNLTILLVDDDPNDVFFMDRALKKVDVSNPIRVASNGQEAIDYLTGSGAFGNRSEYPIPSLMLLDLKMPRKNGFDVLHWMKGQTLAKMPLIIMLSSSAEKRDVDQSYRLGANSYLVKPSTQTKLVDMMQSVKEYWLGYNHYA